MAQQIVARTGIKKERGFLYYCGADGNVWRAKLKRPGERKTKPQKVADAGVDRDDARFVYFITKQGHVARAPRAVGGQKRKKKGKRR